ncbi:hypothetical protein [Streptomyces sp. CBMA123]|uniref:hypothetical protein n=1 Tax=Streptomyces sp. CBMA123 TaxID=1896313 RepID=UPI003982F925
MRPDSVWQAAEIGVPVPVPVLMVEVDRSTMSPDRVVAKFPAYRELFRTRCRAPIRSWPTRSRPTVPCIGCVVPGPATPGPWLAAAPCACAPGAGGGEAGLPRAEGSYSAEGVRL